MSRPPLIWLTRPQADSEALAAQLADREVQTLVAPVMRIVPLYTPPLRAKPGDEGAVPNALLLTSRHAAYMLATLPAKWRSLPVFCVGSATAQAARSAGFSNIVVGEGDVLELLPRMVPQLKPGAQLLYLAGEETRIDVAALLAVQHIHVEKRVVYRAEAETVLTPAALEALAKGTVTAAVFFSPRSATLTAELLAQHGLSATALSMEAYCLSLAVAEAAGVLPWQALHACHIPTAQAMRDLIVSRTHPVV